MKVQIRRGVFETNSSSTHSISIDTSERFIKIPKKLVFKAGEYGWEFHRYSSAEDKASYLFTGIIDAYQKEEAEKYLDIIKEWLEEEGVEEIEFPEITYSEEGWSSKVNGSDYFYVDHASELLDFLEWIFQTKDHLIRFLFSPRSFIATGNDNSDEELDDEVNYDVERFEKWN